MTVWLVCVETLAPDGICGKGGGIHLELVLLRSPGLWYLDPGKFSSLDYPSVDEDLALESKFF